MAAAAVWCPYPTEVWVEVVSINLTYYSLVGMNLADVLQQVSP